MRVEIPYAYADPYLFDETIAECTSVGVLIYTGNLTRGGCPSFLLVEQLDVKDHPWGIPAGRVEPYEQTPVETAVREVREETGISLDKSVLRFFEWIKVFKKEGEEAKIVYAYQVNTVQGISPIENWSYQEGIKVTRERHSEEIGRRAFVPAHMLFKRNHPLIREYYRWDIMHRINARLEELKVL